MFPKRLYFFFITFFFLTKRLYFNCSKHRLRTSVISLTSNPLLLENGPPASLQQFLAHWFLLYIRCCGAGTTDVASELVMVENNRLLGECGLSVPLDVVEKFAVCNMDEEFRARRCGAGARSSWPF